MLVGLLVYVLCTHKDSDKTLAAECKTIEASPGDVLIFQGGMCHRSIGEVHQHEHVMMVAAAQFLPR